MPASRRPNFPMIRCPDNKTHLRLSRAQTFIYYRYIIVNDIVGEIPESGGIRGQTGSYRRDAPSAARRDHRVADPPQLANTGQSGGPGHGNAGVPAGREAHGGAAAPWVSRRKDSPTTLPKAVALPIHANTGRERGPGSRRAERQKEKPVPRPFDSLRSLRAGSTALRFLNYKTHRSTAHRWGGYAVSRWATLWSRPWRLTFRSS